MPASVRWKAVGHRVARTADAVVVGGGTVGAWCAVFLRRSGLDRVVLLEAADAWARVRAAVPPASCAARGDAHRGAPGRVVPRLLLRPVRGDGHRLGLRPPGVLPPLLHRGRRRSRPARRMAMQQELGQAGPVDRRRRGRGPATRPWPRDSTLGGTFLDDDGYIHPPRNVLAYTVALATAGVEVREHTAFDGLVHRGDRVTGVETSGGTVADRAAVVLTGGPQLAAVGARAGTRIPAGGVRHQVAVTEPHPELDPSRVPDGLRRRWPASTGAPRRAACSSG